LYSVWTLAALAGGDMLRTFGQLVERRGPVFGNRLPIGLGMAVMVAHPDAAERVLRLNRGN